MTWQDVNLGDVVTLKRGHDLPNQKRVEGDVPVVSSSGITGWHNEPKAQPPGVVTGRYGTLGEVYFIDKPYWPLNTALYAIDFHENDPKFVAYFLKSVLNGYQSDKAAVPGVDRNVLHKLPVRCPDRQMQERIVTLLSAYDDLIESNRRRIALLEEAARLIYREWFVRFRFPGHERATFVDGLPEGWRRLEFEKVASIVKGKSYKSSELVESGGVSFVNLKCFKRLGGFRVDGIKRFDGKVKDEQRVKPGEIIMAVTDMTRDALIVGRPAIVSSQVSAGAVFSMDLVKVLPKQNVAGLWLYSYLMWSDFPEFIRERASGTNVLHLKPRDIATAQATLPDPRIMDEYSTAVRAFFEQIDKLEAQAIKLAEARDLLLPRLMDGRIEV